MILFDPMLQRDLPIGIFDSGVGGLSVLKHLKKILPSEDYIYLGDAARTPYGTKGAATILQYSKECVNYLESCQVKLIVVACNTASSIAVPKLKQEHSLPMIGMIETASSDAETVVVLGTKATVKSNAYQEKLLLENPQIQILARACPLFVPLVEEGLFEGDVVDRVIEMYLADIKAEGPQEVLLACTHYPLLRPAIERYFGLSVAIIDCGEAAARGVKETLLRLDMLRQDGTIGKISYRVTDDVERFKMVGKLFLGDVLTDVSLIPSLTQKD
jgi:glutamate racemase